MSNNCILACRIVNLASVVGHTPQVGLNADDRRDNVQGAFAYQQVITTEAFGAVSVYATDLDGDGVGEDEPGPVGEGVWLEGPGDDGEAEADAEDLPGCRYSVARAKGAECWWWMLWTVR